ncbi:cyclic AMP receptor-like protein A [Mizuhopecten yessoensis]|uniref:Cyclic AMP receptor-like protein A n=1 Tax=Mizuhopecten yessoensis TaxID=6573 RepID=A0A210PRZ4_MIZYE|nr:cyclic AMP receptor-like protein A [Mizuhopecten yessoensis]OWF39216.1 Cyclic AMP receptor-like protein A [Mizuhopecten yessoensis]
MAGNDSTDNSTVSCLLFPTTPSYCDILLYTRGIAGGLSLVGSSFVLSITWLFRKYTAFVQRMIVYLSISAFFHAIFFMMGGVYPVGPICVFKGFWITYFHWAVLLWDVHITCNLYRNVVRMESSERLEKIFCLNCWGIPLVISLVPLIAGRYGPAGAWCWIVDEWDLERLFLWYIPLFLGIFFMIVVYLYIVYTLNRKASTWHGTYDPDVEQKKAQLRNDITALRFYPLVYLLINIIPLINRIQNAIHEDKPVFALILGQCITAPLQGAINAMIFGADKDTISQLTWSGIKMAFQSRFKKKALIKEYVIEEEITVSPPAGSTNNSIEIMDTHI